MEFETTPIPAVRTWAWQTHYRELAEALKKAPDGVAIRYPLRGKTSERSNVTYSLKAFGVHVRTQLSADRKELLIWERRDGS